MINRKTGLGGLIFVIVAFVTPVVSTGDIVTSKDGEILKGKVVSETAESIVFATPFLGQVTILRENIATLTIDAVPEFGPGNTKREAPFANRLKAIKAPIENDQDESYDWIQLTSGEWLKGKIKAMYSNTLEFDSDELDDQEFDWEDVSRIRTAKNYSVRIDQNTTRTGVLAMKDEQISIDDGGEGAIDQFELISIAPDQALELDNWTAKVSLSSTLRSGTSDQQDISLSGVLQKRTSRRRFYMDFLSNYSETNSETTSNDYRANAYFDSYLTRKIFIRPIFVEYYRDPIQNISRRYTLGASLGYYLIDNRKTTWDATIGPAYQRTEYINVLAGENRTEDDPALVLSTQFNSELTNRLDLVGSHRVQYANRGGGLSFHTLTKLEYELTEIIDLDLALVWDRIEDPTSNEQGDIANNDDIRFTFGIGIDL